MIRNAIWSPLLILLTFLNYSLMKAQDLTDYQWENRILLLFDNSLETNALQSQLAKLTAHEEALIDRDLIVFLVAENRVYTSDKKPFEMDAKRLRERLNIAAAFKGTVLVGKDGGVKLKEKFQVAPETVFSLIDSMPMRRAEVRNRKKIKP